MTYDSEGDRKALRRCEREDGYLVGQNDFARVTEQLGELLVAVQYPTYALKREQLNQLWSNRVDERNATVLADANMKGW